MNNENPSLSTAPGVVWLTLAGVASFCVAVFQAVISCSPAWSVYWGAPMKMAEHPMELLLLGEACAVVFAIFGLYALSGAGRIRRLPLLWGGLITTGALYLLRGMVFVPQLAVLAGFLESPYDLPIRMVFASFVSLAIGIIYLVGTVRSWQNLLQKSGCC